MPINNGYIKLHRKLQSWEWANDPATFCMFIHLLLMANHDDRKWKNITIKKGQLVTSLSSLATKTGLSIQQVRRTLTNMLDSGEITRHTTNRYTVICIDKWDKYQLLEHQSNTPTNKQTTRQPTRQPTTLKENKENKLIPNGINGSKSRNPFVDIVLSEFEKAFGFAPTDKKPRFVAYTFSLNIKKFLSNYPGEFTEARFQKALAKYFTWLTDQDYSTNIETLDTARRKFAKFSGLVVKEYQERQNEKSAKV